MKPPQFYRRNSPAKYKNKKTESHGYLFDSRLEGGLYGYLKMLEQAGEIRNLRVKPNIFLTEARLRMIPDFSAEHKELEWEEVFHEAKGYETDVWRIKYRLWPFYGPGRLRIYKGRAQSFQMVEEVVPKR